MRDYTGLRHSALPNKNNIMDLREIATHFATEGTGLEVVPHGGGHINDSYRVTDGEKGTPDYLLQRVNHYVFKDVDLLMRNMEQVTAHIEAKLRQEGVKDIERRTLKIVPTREGKTWYKDPEGNCWRVLNFIPDHLVFESASDPAIAYEGARMFGGFTRMLDDLPPEGIGDTIPKFHNLKWRLSNLEESIRQDRAGRLSLVRDEIAYVRASTDLMTTIQNLGEKGAIPERITHNDTKINNVLFDKDLKGLCVIDLDTVMPGFVHYDFGDGIRTFTNTGEEDDEDLDRITMDPVLFEAFASGFLDSTRDILSETETSTLVYAGLLFPFIMGVRFLTDYLAGDVYYKIKHGEHNLVRARAQFKLSRDGEAKLDLLQGIIAKLS
jgi:hypothetical protein